MITDDILEEILEYLKGYEIYVDEKHLEAKLEEHITYIDFEKLEYQTDNDNVKNKLKYYGLKEIKQ